MRRRGMALGGDSIFSMTVGAHAPPSESMFERLRRVQERAVAAPIGEPSVEEATLDEQLPDVCSICLEKRERGDSVWTLGCGHCFHASCGRRWLASSSLCPLCKGEVPRVHAEGRGDAPAATGAMAAAASEASEWLDDQPRLAARVERVIATNNMVGSGVRAATNHASAVSHHHPMAALGTAVASHSAASNAMPIRRPVSGAASAPRWISARAPGHTETQSQTGRITRRLRDR
jgi:hypothetical protein